MIWLERSPSQALVDILGTTSQYGLQMWSLNLIVKKYWYTGNNRVSVTSAGSSGVNNLKTRICGGPPSVSPLVGMDQLETTVNCKLCRCSMHGRLFWCLKLNIVMHFTGSQPWCSAWCKPKAFTAFKLVMLFSIIVFILLKNAHTHKVLFVQVEKESKLHLSLWHVNSYTLITKIYFVKLNHINLFSD